MKIRSLLAAAAGLATMTFAAAANAQTIDYGSLQTLFGEPVTTSATGSPQRSTEAPADMQIISADEIRRSGETTLPGLLQRVAGIDVLNSSATQSDVSVRGYDQVSSPRLLVLVNGRQVYQDHYGEVIWASIPVQFNEIRQIEVVKGPNCALFGFNAVSGVINIITYNPKYDKVNIVSGSAGLIGQREGDMVATFKLGPSVSVRLSGGGSAQDQWARTGSLPLASAIEDPATAKVNLDMVAQLSPKTDLRIEGAWSNVQGNVVAGYNYDYNKSLTSSGKATLTSETPYGLVQASAYQNQLTAKYPFGAWQNVIDVAALQDLFKIGADNTFRISTEYRHNSLNIVETEDGKVSYDVWSGSGMWNWAINKQFTTTIAVRVDDLMLGREGTFPARIPYANNSLWSRDLVEDSENLTLAWRPTAMDTFRLSYARGVETPSLVEFGGVEIPYTPFPHFTLDIMGNPFLKPTILTNYEIAYDHDFMVAKFGLRLFHQNLTDLKDGLGTSGISLAPTANTNGAIFYENAANSQEEGAEVTLSGKLWRDLGWHGDATYTSIHDKYFAGINPVGDYVDYKDTTPNVRGNFGLNWSKGPWETDANLHYMTTYQFYNMLNGQLAPVPAHASLDARIAYKLPKGFTVAASGQNLATNRQVQTTGLQAQREAQITLSKAW
jgi:iron complex outermembrane receptor protein